MFVRVRRFGRPFRSAFAMPERPSGRTVPSAGATVWFDPRVRGRRRRYLRHTRNGMNAHEQRPASRQGAPVWLFAASFTPALPPRSDPWTRNASPSAPDGGTALHLEARHAPGPRSSPASVALLPSSLNGSRSCARASRDRSASSRPSLRTNSPSRKDSDSVTRALPVGDFPQTRPPNLVDTGATCHLALPGNSPEQGLFSAGRRPIRPRRFEPICCGLAWRGQKPAGGKAAGLSTTREVRAPSRDWCSEMRRSIARGARPATIMVKSAAAAAIRAHRPIEPQAFAGYGRPWTCPRPDPAPFQVVIEDAGSLLPAIIPESCLTVSLSVRAEVSSKDNRAARSDPRQVDKTLWLTTQARIRRVPELRRAANPGSPQLQVQSRPSTLRLLLPDPQTLLALQRADDRLIEAIAAHLQRARDDQSARAVTAISVVPAHVDD
jgi:hypothetical protein